MIRMCRERYDRFYKVYCEMKKRLEDKAAGREYEKWDSFEDIDAPLYFYGWVWAFNWIMKKDLGIQESDELKASSFDLRRREFYQLVELEMFIPTDKATTYLDNPDCKFMLNENYDCWLYGSFMDDYLYDIEICQHFARRNRERIAEIIIERTGMTAAESFHTIHNYIDINEMVLRKGAIAAHEGEMVLIPINMRDGSVLAIGKGNPEWNYSAPHGAGRVMSRKEAKSTINLEEYKESMNGIYTTSVNEKTIDEAPMAYKALEDIIEVIKDTVDVIDVMKPVYNFKASDDELPWKKK